MSILLDSLLIALGFALCFIGCTLLALSQQHHWRNVTGDRKAIPPRFAGLGWALVLLALIPCILRDGGSFAALLWPLLFAAGAMAVAMTLAMTLAYKPNWLGPLVRLNLTNK